MSLDNTNAGLSYGAVLTPEEKAEYQRLFADEVLKGATPLIRSYIGHDSEFFLWDSKKGKVVPSYRYYPQQVDAPTYRPSRSGRWKKVYTDVQEIQRRDFWGRSLEPMKVKRTPPALLSGHTTKIYRDGLAVEVGVSPLSCRAYMWNDTKITLLRKEPSRRPPHLVFTSRPVVDIDAKLMESFPDDLKVLGCSPSRNAYIDEGATEQEIRVDPMQTFFRSTGSHLHMSFSTSSWLPKKGYRSPSMALMGFPVELAWRLVVLADLLIGVPATYIFGDALEAKRRTLYGRAGEFRIQPYGGVEYRVLSSRLWDHPASYGLFTGLWKTAIGTYFYPLLQAFNPTVMGEVQRVINTADVKGASALLPEVQRMLESAKVWNDIITNGTHTFQRVCSVLRQKRLDGIIKDCGVWSEPFAAEGHTGLNDYLYKWGV